MDQTTLQFSNDSSSPLYLSALSSPNKGHFDITPFYSAPSSPKTNEEEEDDAASNFLDFEFETSQKIGLHGFQFETGQNFFEQLAFADELFANGKVLAPLKLPPRLVRVGGTQSSSTASSPRSPNSVLKIPFPWRNAWNDDFDPFSVALEKVKEERRSRTCQHRRCRSHSPFRKTIEQLGCNSSGEGSNEHQMSFRKTIEQLGCNTSGEGSNEHQMSVRKTIEQLGCNERQMSRGANEAMRQPRGWAYARWVRSHNKELTRPKMVAKFKWYPFRWRVRMIHENENENGGGGGPSTKVEKGIQKLKGILLRYASFGREREK